MSDQSQSHLSHGRYGGSQNAISFIFGMACLAAVAAKDFKRERLPFDQYVVKKANAALAYFLPQRK